MSIKKRSAAAAAKAVSKGRKSNDKIEISKHGDKNVILNYVGKQFETAEDLIKEAEIDMELFEIDRVEISANEVTGKMHLGQNDAGHWLPQELWKSPNKRIKVYLRKKRDPIIAMERLLGRMEQLSPICRKIKRPRLRKGQRKRSLEISIMDPHLGLLCYKPASQDFWTLEECEGMFLWAIDELLELATPYLPLCEIIFPFGNDYLHADNLWHQTTGGTNQPEMAAWHHVYERGAELAITAIDKLKQVAPVKIYQIPGNHDRQSSFTLGRELKAYYRRDRNVTVDAGSDPYKFHKCGVNLIGYDHGHSINQVRYAAVMANECSGPGNPRKGWYDNSLYREWHCGDQHRKGSSKPSAFEEQGVSVEFCPGLTAVNEWHRLKSFSWQKRGAMGWVWDWERGPKARLQVNIDSYSGLPMGEAA